MLAAVLEDIKVLKVREIQKPALTSGSALLKVRSCGFCGSDLKFINEGDRVKKFPAILGHEIAGEVVEVDGKSINAIKVGDRIALGAEVPCLACAPCKKGFENLCNNVLSIGTTIPGGFCEYMLLTPEILQRGPINLIPDELGFNEAALSETLGCVVNALEFARMDKGKAILIIGAGYMGCLTANMAHVLHAAKITMVDNSASRLLLAKEFGADHYICSEGMDSFVEAVMDHVSGEGYDVVMTTCSDINVYNQSILTAAKGGFVNLFGGIKKGYPETVSFSNNYVHYRGISIGGSFSGTRHHHRRALRLLGSNKIMSDKLITHRYKLEEFITAYRTAESRQGLKIIINP